MVDIYKSGLIDPPKLSLAMRMSHTSEIIRSKYKRCRDRACPAGCSVHNVPPILLIK